MTALLTALLGRLPIGWLQLIHNRNRFAADSSSVDKQPLPRSGMCS